MSRAEYDVTYEDGTHVYHKEIATDSIDFKGHSFGGWHNKMAPSLLFSINSMPHINMISVSCLEGHGCIKCGDYLSFDSGEVKGTVVVRNKPCSMADGIVTTVRVNFPSGRVIVADDLRPIFEAEMDHD